MWSVPRKVAPEKGNRAEAAPRQRGADVGNRTEAPQAECYVSTDERQGA
jgi:hypothetical protein